jgi:two-component system sensor histidine kinase BaeS
MRSLRWQILAVCAVVTLVPLLYLNWRTRMTFDTFTARELESRMGDCAVLVGEQYKTLLDAAGALDETQRGRLAAAVQAAEARLKTRIRILGTNGVVLVDSSNNVAGADLSGLPEVQVALGGRYKARFQLTEDRQYMYYYAAVPVKRDGAVCGVVYLARHTGHVTMASLKLAAFQQRTALAAFAIGVALALILAYWITRRLRRVTAAATAFARGQAPFDVRVDGRDEIAELAQAIRRMAGELVRTNRYNREFIATVTHEMKIPVTAIQGAAELLEQGAWKDPAARARFLGNIRVESERLARMVWELGDLTKIETELPHLPREKVEYGTCVREMVERFETTLDAPHAAIRVRLPEEPVFARIVPGRIEQVLGNLLDNAVRYTPAAGAIEVRVEPGADGSVVTTVRDTGSGIAPEHLPHVFERFFSTEVRDRPREYGSGLGLAIARSIVENHQGKIEVASVVGQGTTFRFEFPACGR